MARHLATSGYAVVAPDLLSPRGGVASFRNVDADVQRAVTATTAAAVTPQMIAALSYVKSHGGGGGRGLGLVGFGWGGTQAVLFAAGRSDVAACVAFYPDPKLALPALAKTHAPVLAILAGDDPETSGAAERFAQVTVAGRTPHVAKLFAGAGRGFHDPGAAKIYKADLAKQAWTAAIDHLDAHTKKAQT
jgi:carboxymethylenebutenolidase